MIPVNSMYSAIHMRRAVTKTKCCVFARTAAPPTCSAIMFTCNNTRCLPAFLVCNGVNDCGDFSDEAGCGRSTCANIIHDDVSAKNERKINFCDKFHQVTRI